MSGDATKTLQFNPEVELFPASGKQTEAAVPFPEGEGNWKVLVVDDDESVHQITRMVLRHEQYLGASIQLYHAYSAQEARDMLTREPGIAVVLLDVVMETSEAGLDLVRFIREEHENSLVRIVLRTGQPAMAPARKVILGYDIHDYKTKTELTDDKLFTTVVTALRSFQALNQLESYRGHLEDKVAQRTRELKAKNEHLEALHQENEGILSMVVHDLRTPFSQIKGLAELLESDDITGEERAFMLQKINESTDNGLHLIEDLMLVSRKKRGAMDALRKRETIEVEAFLQGFMPYYQQLAQKKNIDLQWANTAGSTQMLTDVPYFKRILDNLITNAIKFTFPGKQVMVSATLMDEQEVRLAVIDEGQGIKSKELPKLFTRFARLSARPTGTEDSTGLGLSIVKALAEYLGGRVWAESQWQKGSTFYVQLPLQYSIPEA